MTNMVKTSGRALRVAETLIILTFCVVHCCQAAPVISKDEIVIYLTEFGYLKSSDSTSEEVSKEELSKAIASFQNFMKLDVTGKMDMQTIQLMTLPRCGVMDKITIKSKSGGKSEAYEVFGTKWGQKSLTYKISKYPARLSRDVVDQEIARALGVWSGYTDLTFTPMSGEVDIEIRFERGYHGDDNPFDGPGSIGRSNVLAHAFSPAPGIGGDTHFDDDEFWTVNQRHGSNLFQVAAHEFGHALGLDHSRVSSALMAPYYRGYQSDFRLDSDDIRGIQALYGPKTGYRKPPVSRYPNTDDNSIFRNRGRNDSPWTKWWNPFNGYY